MSFKDVFIAQSCNRDCYHVTIAYSSAFSDIALPLLDVDDSEGRTSLRHDMQEFLISPVQLGIPYSRPRYFAIMKRAAKGLPTALPLQVCINSPFITVQLHVHLIQLFASVIACIVMLRTSPPGRLCIVS